VRPPILWTAPLLALAAVDDLDSMIVVGSGQIDQSIHHDHEEPGMSSMLTVFTGIDVNSVYMDQGSGLDD